MPSLVFKDAEQARDSICIEDQKRIRDLYADWADKVAERAEFYEKKTTASSYWQQQQMLELERQLRSQSMQIHKEIGAVSRSSMHMVADSVVGCNAEFLKALGFKEEGINAAFTSVPDKVVSNIVTGQIYKSGWSLSKAIWTDNQKTLSDIYSIVAQGRAMNMSAYEVSKMLERYVSPGRKMQWNLKMNDGAKIYKKTVDYNAQRLVRTLNQHAYQQSIIQVVKDNPFISGIYWRANGSRVCPLCMDRDGNFYKWSELPMDHPNGMCTMEPATDMDKTIDQLADWIKEPDGTYPEIDKFAKKLGYEPTPAVINAGLPNEQKTRDKDWTFKNCTSPEMTKGWGYGKDFREELTSKLMMASDQYRAVFSKASKSIKTFVTDSTNSSYFNSGGWSGGKSTISLNKDGMQYKEAKGINKFSTIFHEMGHAIDNLAPGNDRVFSSMPKYGFQDAMIQDMLHIKEKVVVDREYLFNLRRTFADNNSHGVQDAWTAMKHFESTSQKVVKRDLKKIAEPIDYKVVPHWGHSDSYWKRSDAVKECASELFANISSAQVSEKEMQYMREYFPRSCDKFDEIMKEVASKVK